MEYLNNKELKTKRTVTIEFQNVDRLFGETIRNYAEQERRFIAFCLLTGGFNAMRDKFEGRVIDIDFDTLEELKNEFKYTLDKLANKLIKSKTYKK